MYIQVTSDLLLIVQHDINEICGSWAPVINTAPLNLAVELVQYRRFPKNQGAQCKGDVVPTWKKQPPTALPCLYEQGFEGFVIGILVLIK